MAGPQKAGKRKKAKRAKRKNGRPTKAAPLPYGLVLGILTMGGTDEQAAAKAGIVRKTLYAWRKADPDFAEACQEAKAHADAQVVATLYRSATGQVVLKRVPKVAKTEVYYVDEPQPPSVTAAIFWLCNRQPDDWRQRQTVEGDPNRPVEVTITRKPALDVEDAAIGGTD